jgi:hypothetical protein
MESHATVLILLVADVIVSDLYEATMIGVFARGGALPFREYLDSKTCIATDMED